MKTNIVNSFDDQSYDELIQQVTTKASNLLQLDDRATLTVVLTTDEQVRSLNHQFRGKDDTTDVLTFPDGSMHHLGDVIISMPKCHAQSVEYGHSLERELGFLVVHGMLHTLGYTHDTVEDETTMFALQERILQKAKLTR